MKTINLWIIFVSFGVQGFLNILQYSKDVIFTQDTGSGLIFSVLFLLSTFGIIIPLIIEHARKRK